MIKRKRYDKLPLQANFYPVPSMAYIQDKTSRLSLISGQPLGGSSAVSGALEIMLDRRLMQVRVRPREWLSNSPVTVLVIIKFYI